LFVTEADVEGAYNITRESAERSAEAKRKVDASEGHVATSEKLRREAQQLLDSNQQDFDKQFESNQAALEELGTKVTRDDCVDCLLGIYFVGDDVA
jgi:hypothetical protein